MNKTVETLEVVAVVAAVMAVGIISVPIELTKLGVFALLSQKEKRTQNKTKKTLLPF